MSLGVTLGDGVVLLEGADGVTEGETDMVCSLGVMDGDSVGERV